MTLSDKSQRLLSFLRAMTAIRAKRVTAYGENDQVVFFADLPAGSKNCKSAFFPTAEAKGDSDAPWLSIRKPRLESPPRPGESLKRWYDDAALDDPAKEPVLLHTATLDPPAAAAGPDSTGDQTASLADHPEVVEQWRTYLEEEWRPWAERAREATTLLECYAQIDEMRKRADESADRYELLIALGLLQWKDDAGGTITRHMLVGPAEISLNAARGELTVEPSGAFASLRLELDMLASDPPVSVNAEQELADLGADVTDAARVIDVLKVVANQWRADAQVGPDLLEAAKAASGTPRLSYAPAILLRQRRVTTYAAILSRLLSGEEEMEMPSTSPWAQLLAEGATVAETEPVPGQSSVAGAASGGDAEQYFPLPSNEDQERILELLRHSPGVIVKGPPGTGKSHTIANLICHLLAKGERVLVTAQAPKALGVLRGLLPESVQKLCVTALGSDRQEHQILEQSVRGILSRKDEWPGPERSAAEIRKLEAMLATLRTRRDAVERRLRESREAETSPVNLPGGYTGTGAKVARRLEAEREKHGWFPADALLETACPLTDDEIRLVARAHDDFPVDSLADIDRHLGTVPFQGPEWFSDSLRDLREARKESERAGSPPNELERASLGDLNAMSAAIPAIDGLMARAERSLGALALEVLADAAVGRADRWKKVVEKAAAAVAGVEPMLANIPETPPQIADGIDRRSLLDDVRRRRKHLAGGGWGGVWILAPKDIRETRHVESVCHIGGKPCTTPSSLEALEAHLVAEAAVRALSESLPALAVTASTLAAKVDGWRDHVAELTCLVNGVDGLPIGWAANMPPSAHRTLASEEGRRAFLAAIRREIARRDASDIEASLDRLRARVAAEAGAPQSHPCLSRLLAAINDRDEAAYATHQPQHAKCLGLRQRWLEYKNLLTRADAACPGLADLLERHLHEEGWPERAGRLRDAWAWAAARRSLGESLDPHATDRLDEQYRRIRDEYEKSMEELVAEKAWLAFFERLTEGTRQRLIAWQSAVRKIGRGTGKFATKHRQDAREHLSHCIAAMPAWVMPLHKLWDTVDAAPGLFDTIIVDEASQAGLDSLLLLLLAKSIIVVGDDKQNSPDEVGVNQTQVNHIARDHLDAFAFKSEYRTDSSLFDHAARAFRSQVMLREHFRCVPEIIRFSNTLFYEGKLVPLRLVPPRDRLEPLKSVFLPEGTTQGKDYRISNEAEAEAIAATIARLVEDETYAGKTIGVIALQGRAQAELITRKLSERLPAAEIEDRRIRCGEPPNFQGDQRDVILLSMVAAPNQNFTALTTPLYERRYNVAMSRARDQVWLFHSVTLQQLSPSDMRHRLLAFFLSPAPPTIPECDIGKLRNAVAGHRTLGNQPPPFESWFELDVCLALLERGYCVQPQVEVSHKRIDLVIEGSDGRLAVECDGEHWHGADAFAEDMARQRQLERAGWTFERVRESAFYADRQAAIDKVVAACDAMNIHPWSADARAIESQPVGSSPFAHTLDSAASEEITAPEIAEAITADETNSEAAEGSIANDEPLSADIRDDAIPFSGYSEACGFPDPREASPANVRNHVLEIITRDGPLLRSSVARLYLRGCPGVSRLGKEIQRSLNRAIGTLISSGAIVLSNELRPGDADGQVVRVAGSPPVRSRVAGRRSLEEIPPSELLAWLDERPPTTGELFPTDRDACSRYLLERAGGQVMTLSKRKHLEKVFSHWQRPLG